MEAHEDNRYCWVLMREVEDVFARACLAADVSLKPPKCLRLVDCLLRWPLWLYYTVRRPASIDLNLSHAK